MRTEILFSWCLLSEVCRRGSQLGASVTREMCVFSLWDCEGREGFRIDLHPDSWSFGTSGLGRFNWANGKVDFKGWFWSNNPSAATSLLFMDGSLNREENTVGEPDYFGVDSNNKSSQAKGIFRLIIDVSLSDGDPLLPCLTWLWGKLSVCRSGGLEPCSMSVGVSAPLTVVGDAELNGCHRAPLLRSKY